MRFVIHSLFLSLSLIAWAPLALADEATEAVTVHGLSLYDEPALAADFPTSRM